MVRTGLQDLKLFFWHLEKKKGKKTGRISGIALKM
jgi:hypothetical protein